MVYLLIQKNHLLLFIYLPISLNNNRDNFHLKKEYKRRIYNPDGSYREVVQPGVYSPQDTRKKEKTLLTELDVQNPREKRQYV